MTDLSHSGPITAGPVADHVDAASAPAEHKTLAADHVAGGSTGLVLGAVIVGALNRFAHTHFSDADALLIGGAALSVGAGLGHIVGHVGIIPAFRRALFGSSS